MFEDMTFMRAYLAYEAIFHEAQYINNSICVQMVLNNKYFAYADLLNHYGVDY